MIRFDFEAAKLYALKRLEKELSPSLVYHSLAHTRSDVVPAAERLANIELVNGESRLLLITAAWYHDIGYIKQYFDHEQVGACIAEEALPDFYYKVDQISVVKGIILATRLPQSPHTHLEEIMVDADLDSLGREDFMSLNRNLRLERESLDSPINDLDWYVEQLEFMRAHQYFTESARALRGDGKQRNIERINQSIEKLKVNER